MTTPPQQRMLSQRAIHAAPSPTLAITAKANALKAQGKDVISFGAGEPDFDTPQNVKDAAVAALGRGDTKYTPSSGTPALKDAIIAKLKRDNGLTYGRNEIIVSCGAKHSIYNVMQAMLDPGDEVIVPVPLLGVLPGAGEAGRWRAGHRSRRRVHGLPDHGRFGGG